jgi:hypothetical protein
MIQSFIPVFILFLTNRLQKVMLGFDNMQAYVVECAAEGLPHQHAEAVLVRQGLGEARHVAFRTDME